MDGNSQRGALYLAPPQLQTANVVRAALTQAGFRVEQPFDGVFCVRPAASELCRLGAALADQLDEAELESIKCRIVPSSAAPKLAKLMQTQSLARLISELEGRWLSDVLRDRRLSVFFQPIVRCAAPGRVFAYECLLRGRQSDGTLIGSDQLFSAARGTGMLAAVDRFARLAAIESVAQHRIDAHVFINFSPSSIRDPLECLESTARAALESHLTPNQFVFEVIESEEIDDLGRLLRILDFLREAGFGVALDDLGAGHSSLNLLASVKPDYVKLDMGLLHHVDRDRYKSQVASKLLELARTLGVASVVEGVETESEWRWARNHGADYAQGFLFAVPEERPGPSRFEGTVAQPSSLTDTIDGQFAPSLVDTVVAAPAI